MDATENYLQCYNKGCGLKFTADKIGKGDCCYHPGAPIFHDAYKGWSCCNKKSTDFTTFLNTKGCTQGEHNTEKPKEVEKQKPDPFKKDEIVTVKTPSHNDVVRPDFDSLMSRLTISVTPSLKSALNKKVEKIEEANVEENEVFHGIRIGELCKNNGCKASFNGPESNLGICLYHPGFPIFHEGMKFWYCCQRKTSDFEVFLQQEGCTSGSHIWIKKNLKKSTCRYDWHQTPTHVYVTIYAKIAQPELSSVEVNAIRLRCHIVFEDDNEFELDNELGGVITPNECSVSMAGTKVEIKLKKDFGHHWNKLFMPPPKDDKQSNEESEENDIESSGLNSKVEAVDLSDI